MNGRERTLGTDIEMAVAAAAGGQVSGLYIAAYLVGLAAGRGDLTAAREAELLALLTAPERMKGVAAV